MVAELLLGVLLVLAWSIFFSQRSSVRRKKLNLPPNPFKFPILGNLPQLISLSPRSLCVLSRRHGPLMHLQVGQSVVVVASSAAMAQEVMKTHDVVFASRPRLVVAELLSYGLNDVVFAPYGEHWRQGRRVCVLHLLSAKRVQSHRSVREDEVASFVGEISQQSSLGAPVDLSAMVRVFMSGVVSRVALGRKYPERWRLMDEAAALLGEFFVEDYFPRLAWVSRLMGKHDRVRRCFKGVDSFLDEVIEDHAGSHGRPDGEDEDVRDLVDVMLALQQDEDAGIFLTRRDCIKAIILYDKSGIELDRTDVFILNHTRKDGTPVNVECAAVIEQLKSLKNAQPSSSSSRSVAEKNDLYVQVLGPDKPGQVRGVGTGPTPSSMWGTANEQLRVENRRLNDKFKDLESRFSEMEKMLRNGAAIDNFSTRIIQQERLSLKNHRSCSIILGLLLSVLGLILGINTRYTCGRLPQRRAAHQYRLIHSLSRVSWFTRSHYQGCPLIIHIDLVPYHSKSAAHLSPFYCFCT